MWSGWYYLHYRLLCKAKRQYLLAYKLADTAFWLCTVLQTVCVSRVYTRNFIYLLRITQVNKRWFDSNPTSNNEFQNGNSTWKTCAVVRQVLKSQSFQTGWKCFKCVPHQQTRDTHGINAGLMLGQRRRRWANIEPTLDPCLLFAASLLTCKNALLHRSCF